MDVFLETERKDCCRVQSRGARAGGGVVFLHTDVHEAGGGASGVSDQTVSGYGGCATIPGMRMPSPSRPYRRGTRCRAVELCLSGMQQKQVATELGVSAGAAHHWMRLYRAGGMAASETGTEGCHAAGRNR